MRVALAQINPTVGDFSGNLAKMQDRAKLAGDKGAALVIFPELAVSGYPPADLLEKTSFVQRAEASLRTLAELTAAAGSPSLLVGSPMRCDVPGQKQVRNVAAVLEAGEIRFVQAKMLLPFADVFDEQRYFEPAAQQELTTVKGKAVAITICEDAWNDKMFWPRQNYALDPVEELMKQWGALPQTSSAQRLILNISASPYWHHKPETRREMIGALARRHHATVVMVNQVGANDSLIFDGDSFALNANGEVIAQARAFAEDLVVFDTLSGASDEAAGASKTVRAVAAPRAAAECQRTWDALVLGTQDYLRKCGFRRALVGLSGGIDSALVAAIAVEALGADNVQGIGMPSEFSSSGSLTDAELLANHLGIRFDVLPIRDIYDQFTHRLEPFFANRSFGLAEEYVKPSIRGTLLIAV